MAGPRRYDEAQKRYYDLESKEVAKALAPWRGGTQHALREKVRCMLVLLMGHEDCNVIPRGTKIPHWMPGLHRRAWKTDWLGADGYRASKQTFWQAARSQLKYWRVDEIRALAVATYDGLLELGYDAAAHELASYGRNPHFTGDLKYIQGDAKRALENLEAGPPSIMVGEQRYGFYAVFRKPMYRLKGTRWSPDQEVVVAKAVTMGKRQWIRFLVQQDGSLQRQTFHTTLADAQKGSSYG